MGGVKLCGAGGGGAGLGGVLPASFWSRAEQLVTVISGVPASWVL